MIALNYNTKNKKYRDILSALPQYIHDTDFHSFAFRLGFSPDDVATICNKSLKTVKRWEANGAEPWVYILLYACSGRILHEDWQSFQVKDGKLWTGSRITYNDGFKPAVIHNYTATLQYMKTLENENDRLRRTTGDNVQVIQPKRRTA